MLVLTRHVGQSVYLQTADGQVIKVTVNEFERGRVRIGFTAPQDIAIHRDEMFTTEQRTDMDSRARGG